MSHAPSAPALAPAPTAPTLELGLDTFGDVTADADGRLLTHAEVLRNVVAEAELADPHGALCVGSPETVAAKIVRVARALGLARFDLKYSPGTLPHAAMMRSIELYATEVAPRVHAALAAEA